MAKHIQAFTERQKMLSAIYEAYHYSDPYLTEVALHHHDFYEIYFFISGDVEYTVENRIYRPSPGDVLLISPLELHQLRIRPEPEPYERLVLWVDRAHLEQLSTTRTSLSRCFDLSRPEHSNLLQLTPAQREPLTALMEQLVELRESEAYGADLLAESYLLQLLVRLNQLADEPRRTAAAFSSDLVVDGVLNYINEHYNEPLTLDFLAEKFFVSKYHLLRKFDRQVGTSVHRYLLQKRLMIAKQLLSGGLAPTEVYQHCGFGDYANFYRAFKAEYAVTPKEFARSFAPVG